MNKYIKHLLPIMLGSIVTMMATACGNEDEVPPRNEQTVTVKNYKMPDPTPLNNSDKATIDAIKDEYKKATEE